MLALPPWLDLALHAAVGLLAFASLLALRNLSARVVPRDQLDAYVSFRLLRTLPLPHLGDRRTLLLALRDVAPARGLALWAVGNSTLMVAQRESLGSPGHDVGRYIELHRDALTRGEPVYEQRCDATLIPAHTRAGDLRAALAVSGRMTVLLDDEARASLRYVAGVLERPLEVSLWPQPLTPERAA